MTSVFHDVVREVFAAIRIGAVFFVVSIVLRDLFLAFVKRFQRSRQNKNKKKGRTSK